MNDAVEIGAEWSVNEVTIGLSDRPLLEVLSYLDIAFFLPCRSWFLKTGMEQGKDQTPSMFESSNARTKGREIVWDIHKDHIRNHEVKGIWQRGPCREIFLDIVDTERLGLLSLDVHRCTMDLKARRR